LSTRQFRYFLALALCSFAVQEISSVKPRAFLAISGVASWRSGKTEADVFPDALPWLYVGDSADTLPWAARHLD
jgi:hypothetical protein